MLKEFFSHAPLTLNASFAFVCIFLWYKLLLMLQMKFYFSKLLHDVLGEPAMLNITANLILVREGLNINPICIDHSNEFLA